MHSHKRPATSNAGSPAGIPDGIADLLGRSDSEAIEALQQLAAGPDRETAKAARKALFRLGIRPTAPREVAAPQVAARTQPGRAADTALITLSDQGGARLIAFGHGETHTPCWAFVSEWQKGITAAEALPRSLSSLEKEIIEDAPEGHPRTYVRLDADDARRVLDTEARRTPSASGFLPAGYRKCRQAVGGEDRSGDEAPIYARVGQTQARGSGIVLLDTDADGQPVLPIWALRGAEISDLAERVRRALDTRIVLPERQQADLVSRIMREAAADLLPPQRVQNLCARIESDALVMWHIGERDFAAKAARIAHQGRAVTSASDWPFALALLSYSLRRAWDPKGVIETQPTGEDSESLIIRP